MRKVAGLSETNGFGKKRIMIVDHNEEEQKTVKKMLGEEYEVLVAETGKPDFTVEITVTS